MPAIYGSGSNGRTPVSYENKGENYMVSGSENNEVFLSELLSQFAWQTCVVCSLCGKDILYKLHSSYDATRISRIRGEAYDFINNIAVKKVLNGVYCEKCLSSLEESGLLLHGISEALEYLGYGEEEVERFSKLMMEMEKEKSYMGEAY